MRAGPKAASPGDPGQSRSSESPPSAEQMTTGSRTAPGHLVVLGRPGGRDRGVSQAPRRGKRGCSRPPPFPAVGTYIRPSEGPSPKPRDLPGKGGGALRPARSGRDPHQVRAQLPAPGAGIAPARGKGPGSQRGHLSRCLHETRDAAQPCVLPREKSCPTRLHTCEHTCRHTSTARVCMCPQSITGARGTYMCTRVCTPSSTRAHVYAHAQTCAHTHTTHGHTVRAHGYHTVRGADTGAHRDAGTRVTRVMRGWALTRDARACSHARARPSC